MNIAKIVWGSILSAVLAVMIDEALGVAEKRVRQNDEENKFITKL